MPTVNLQDLLRGRNPYGTVGGDITNIMAQLGSNNVRTMDPRLANAGFMVRDNSMDENSGSHGGYVQYRDQDRWNSLGEPLINGQRYVQIGGFADKNPDDFARLFKDPSQVSYDENAGLVTPYDNFIGRTPDTAVTRLMHAGIAAAALAGTGIGIGNAFFGGPSLTSVLGSSAAGSGGGAFGPEGGLKPGAVSGGGGVGGGAGGSGLLGSGGGEAATGAFDTAGWQGTGINGATGTRGMLGQMAYNAQGFLNNPAGWAMNNPVDAIRGASSLYNLGSSIVGPRGNTRPSSNTGSKGGQGGQTQINAPQSQYYVNPITQMQLAQLYGGRK